MTEPTVAEEIGALSAELAELREIRRELERIAGFSSVAVALDKARTTAARKRDRLASNRTLDRSAAEMAASGEAEELGQALAFIRDHNQTRRAILAKVGTRS